MLARRWLAGWAQGVPAHGLTRVHGRTGALMLVLHACPRAASVLPAELAAAEGAPRSGGSEGPHRDALIRFRDVSEETRRELVQGYLASAPADR